MTSALRSLALGMSLFCLAFSGRQNSSTDTDLVAHEWGTFTSIAGRNGQAVRWSPLNGSSDLPAFVEHLNGAQYKAGLRGSVRMETPVLYFYSPHETSVSVKVAFSKGMITEWYPHASHVEPDPKNVFDSDALYRHPRNGGIAWDSVAVSPKLTPNFLRSAEGRQYYTARETAASPLVVKTATGEEQEKFLFYRGVSTFSVPLTATITPEGKVHIRDAIREEIPEVILFERRGDKLGYRLGGAVQGEMSLDPPELTATFESMGHDLEDVLTRQGLYPDEARAMIETWRDSWFEEGSRLFYIVPGQFLNKILPLSINPVPSQTVRVFVGRLELVTPATQQAVEHILTTQDVAALGKYNRFLEPILAEMKEENPAKAPQIDRDLELTYRSGWETKPGK